MNNIIFGEVTSVSDDPSNPRIMVKLPGAGDSVKISMISKSYDTPAPRDRVYLVELAAGQWMIAGAYHKYGDD